MLVSVRWLDLISCFIDWLGGMLVGVGMGGSLRGWPCCWMDGWLVCMVVCAGRLIGFFGRLVGLCGGESVRSLVGWLVGWLNGWWLCVAILVGCCVGMCWCVSAVMLGWMLCVGV